MLHEYLNLLLIYKHQKSYTSSKESTTLTRICSAMSDGYRVIQLTKRTLSPHHSNALSIQSSRTGQNLKGIKQWPNSPPVWPRARRSIRSSHPQNPKEPKEPNPSVDHEVSASHMWTKIGGSTARPTNGVRYVPRLAQVAP